jgi:hypothetical protein
MPSKSRRITASQVGQYAYCAQAWWLGVVEGCEPRNVRAIRAGTAVHGRHGWRVSLARGAGLAALALLGIACLALLIWAVARLVF